jgi:4-amino-4-deoxy-L-arabinose transferase-like glycosyltransferase
LLAALCVLYFGLLGTIPLLDPDEGRYAEIPREMLASGDFVTPHLNGVAYLEKPPLYYWGTALGLTLFGENEFGARVFGAAASVLGVVLTFWMGVELAGPRTGLYAAAILATSFYYYVVGRLNTIDMTLGVLLVVAIFPAYLYLSGKRAERRYLYLAYAGAALAFLAKGLIGVIFPAAILLLWAILAKRLREVPRMLSWVGLAIFLGGTRPRPTAAISRSGSSSRSSRPASCCGSRSFGRRTSRRAGTRPFFSPGKTASSCSPGSASSSSSSRPPTPN